ASERLFGGALTLRRRIAQEAGALGVQACAHAGTAMAALALARHALSEGRDAAHPDDEDAAHAGTAARISRQVNSQTGRRLDALPLQLLPGVSEHQATLARLGCRTLGDVRRLPRGGLSRRFGAALLRALDQAHGLSPETFDWVQLPA